MTKENALRLVEYLPQTVPVDGLIKAFYRLENMEEEQGADEIDWDELKKEIDSW
ncbi:hypothetical protein [Mucilaginibacter gotjawali]|uniref:Uncharacterized protein n=1 Tax=Mucilaginibacter gotjawali TaxID=1550579 RepID=A0A839SB20_9SPHI|nr:hypothetical protein [Mucilaginibacter gotjawali]MBB3054443.1 hypothetical protein [Mucilaginibacter gotjawali]